MKKIIYFDEERDFTRLENCVEKVEIAISRLENPYGLTDEKIVMYQNYLFNQAPKIAQEFIDLNRTTLLPLLVKYRVIKKTNVLKLTDYAREQKKNDILFYLMEAGHLLKTNSKNLEVVKKHTPGKSPLPPAENTYNYRNSRPGEIIWLGADPMPWQVLENKDGRLLLISKYVIDCMPIDDFFRGHSEWRTCSIRRRLNKEYIDALLTQKEKDMTVPVYIDWDDTLSFDNPKGLSDDRFFYLNVKDAQRYFRTDRDRMAPVTKYAIRSMLWTVFDQYAHWWLRTQGEQYVDIYYVRDGIIMSENSTVQGAYFEHFGVRPAMYFCCE
ncbi:MAG: hypothetical protein IJ410_07930 [Oscillospiraceae bacterium]|nr:hypothetical protein [Oscillospiraceae bacterium]